MQWIELHFSSVIVACDEVASLLVAAGRVLKDRRENGVWARLDHPPWYFLLGASRSGSGGSAGGGDGGRGTGNDDGLEGPIGNGDHILSSSGGGAGLIPWRDDWAFVDGGGGSDKDGISDVIHEYGVDHSVVEMGMVSSLVPW